jgi:CRP-like cAMP-binding protein
VFRIFQHWPDEQLATLAAIGIEQAVQTGQSVFSEGQRGQDLFIGLAGGLDAYHATPSGRQTIGRLRVGQIFGELSFVDRQPRCATVAANQLTAVLRFDAAPTRQAALRDPLLAAALSRSFWYSLAAKIRHANEHMAELLRSAPPPPAPAATPPGESINVRPAAKLELFAEQGLSAAQLRLLATTLDAQRFAPGAYVFMEGDGGDSLYIVVEGEVRISRRIGGNGEEMLAVLQRGEVFGEMAIVDDEPRSADARANDSGCTVLALSHRDLDDVLGLGPEAASQFLQMVCAILAKRLRSMIETLVSVRSQV